jgi:hypothetical protein
MRYNEHEVKVLKIRLEQISQAIEEGKLVFAFKNLEYTRLKVDYLINKSFGENGDIIETQNFSEIIDSCNALKGKLLKEMARQV